MRVTSFPWCSNALVADEKLDDLGVPWVAVRAHRHDVVEHAQVRLGHESTNQHTASMSGHPDVADAAIHDHSGCISARVNSPK